jgi:hypothetical protein
MIALAIGLGISAVAFRLFHQSERAFRDQAIITEMQQTARLLISQIVDDIRVAGQGIPPGLSDVILPGSNASRLNIRANWTGAEAMSTSPLPLSLTLGSPVTIGVESTLGFSANRQVFVFDGVDWVRATINSVSGAAKTIRLTPTALSKPVMSLSMPILSTDEAVSIYRDPALQAVRRTTSTNTENAAAPVWAAANELATNVTELNFQYLDRSGMQVAVDTSVGRAQIVGIEVRITARTSTSLSDGSRPDYSLSVRTSARNLQLR